MTADAECHLFYVCHSARSYLRVSDVTAAAASVGVAMGDDDYVILNGDLSFYAPPPTATDPVVGVGGRCSPWLGVLNPTERAVFVEIDRSFRDHHDVITCTVPSTTGSRRHHEASSQYMLLFNFNKFNFN